MVLTRLILVFQKTLNLLDSADRVVDEALERLSHVRVDLRSHPKASDEEEWATGGARDECHTLLDYTDQTACDNVRASIRESIDRVNAAEGQLVDVSLPGTSSTQSSKKTSRPHISMAYTSLGRRAPRYMDQRRGSCP